MVRIDTFFTVIAIAEYSATRNGIGKRQKATVYYNSFCCLYQCQTP
ncbi:hypothetical protein [Moorena producens]|nr:hypothetical protein [Moorena producens]